MFYDLNNVRNDKYLFTKASRQRPGLMKGRDGKFLVQVLPGKVDCIMAQSILKNDCHTSFPTSIKSS